MAFRDSLLDPDSPHPARDDRASAGGFPTTRSPADDELAQEYTTGRAGASPLAYAGRLAGGQSGGVRVWFFVFVFVQCGGRWHCGERQRN